MGLLDGGLQREIGLNADILALMLDGVLTKHTDGELIDYKIQRIATDYAVKGFFDIRRSAVLVGGSPAITKSTQKIAIILAFGLLVEPKAQDGLLLQGKNYLIQSVETDPANATYTLVLTDV